MHIDRALIRPSNTTFTCIIPGIEARCSGSLTLDIVFGTPENLWSKELIFDIIPFWSGNHALLGRTSFTRFHVIPHFAYLKLKMPGPNGVIIVNGNKEHSLRIEEQTATFASKVQATEEASKARDASSSRDHMKRPKSGCGTFKRIENMDISSGPVNGSPK